MMEQNTNVETQELQILTPEEIEQNSIKILEELKKGKELIASATLYQVLADRTSVFKDVFNSKSLSYYAMGLGGESGELLNKIKKIIRGDYGTELPEEKRKDIQQELGDILWYIAALCTFFGFGMNEVMTSNILKLNKRHSENKIHGEGDNR